MSTLQLFFYYFIFSIFFYINLIFLIFVIFFIIINFYLLVCFISYIGIINFCSFLSESIITTSLPVIGIFSVLLLFICIVVLIVLRGGAPRYQIENITTISFQFILIFIICIVSVFIILFYII